MNPHEPSKSVKRAKEESIIIAPEITLDAQKPRSPVITKPQSPVLLQKFGDRPISPVLAGEQPLPIGNPVFASITVPIDMSHPQIIPLNIEVRPTSPGRTMSPIMLTTQ